MLVKSPLFVKLQVKMNQKTKIDVSLGTFGGVQNPSLQSNLANMSISQKQIQMTRSLHSESTGVKGSLIGTAKRTREQIREDNEAELETLRNVKIFLTEKLKQNEQVTCTFQ